MVPFSNMPRKTLFVWSLGLTLVVLAAYGNHFQNGFHFDDFNTVTQNTFIRDLRNIPRFFFVLPHSSIAPRLKSGAVHSSSTNRGR